jgi:hypothetical protein
MSQSSSLIWYPGGILSREDFALVPTPRQLNYAQTGPASRDRVDAAETPASGISASSLTTLYRGVG